jgi:aquaporin Z
LISIPIDNASVNPARSTGPAIFAGGEALRQLWMFWVMPILGGAVAGYLYPLVFGEIVSEEPVVGETPGHLTA